MQELKFASIKEALADGGRPCMPIKALLANTAFDAETTRLLGQAYDLACSELRDDGQPAVVKEIIAKRIIELAGDGERDPKKLSAAALTYLAFRLASKAPQLFSLGYLARHAGPKLFT
jgi:hypothetical protein